MTRLDWNEKRLAQHSLPGDGGFSDVDVVYKNRDFYGDCCRKRTGVISG
ncbi:MAG: hypothetical protein ABFC78_01700 [Methanoregula sp.]